MYRRLYLLLALVRVYFALQPSYVHPDEHFQGPEIIIGEIFGWPSFKTWEFTSDQPVRSLFPLWLVYGPPLTLLRWICTGAGYGEVSPMTIFYTLRTLMLLLSFVLEDWALCELLPAKRERALALTLVASSYVTWTYQAHTFSNSVETVLVLWCIVFMARIRKNNERVELRSCASLAFLGVVGIFNRITFPAFLVVPAVAMGPSLLVQPSRLLILFVTGASTIMLAIAADTHHYSGHRLELSHLRDKAVLTPWNNFAYNMDSSNLAEHGLHSFWQHSAANLPQLIGPAVPLLFTSFRKTTMCWSGVTGIAVLSCFRHQEPRFLLPAVPLLLASVKIPPRFVRLWTAAWVMFNVIAGILFGVYHQGGVIPAQAWISTQTNVSQVLWWKTYSPPRWLLGRDNDAVDTLDLMGMSGEDMMKWLTAIASCKGDLNKTLIVAPKSALFLDSYIGSTGSIQLTQVFEHRAHVGLDDLEFGSDGILPTLSRVVGRRGLIIYQASKQC